MRFLWAACCAASIVLATAAVSAASTSIAVLNEHTISWDAPHASHAESDLAVNPRNPKNFIASAAAITNGMCLSVVYYTLDGGSTWRRGTLPVGWTKNASRNEAGADAMVYFDHSGQGYFIMEKHGGFWVSRSTDGGKTWDEPSWTLRDEGFDRPVVSFGTGAYNDRMFLTAASDSIDRRTKSKAALATSASDDGGRTFGPEYIHAELGPFPLDTLVDPDGHLYVPFGNLGKPSKEKWLGQFWIRASANGGKSYTPAYRIGNFTWSTGPIDERNQSMPRAAIDLSDGRYRGRMYIVYSQLRGKRYDVDVIHSMSDWKHWSRPVTVNDNRTTAEHGDPAIAVNNAGAVAVTWADRRDDPAANCYRLGIAASVDGGETFSKNAVLHRPTCPADPRNWQIAPVSVLSYTLPPTRDILLLSAPARWWDGGDTQGLVSTPDGAFQAAWINGESGTMQLWFTQFTVTGNAIARTESPLAPAGAAVLAPLTAYLSVGVAIDIVRCDFDLHAGTLALTVRLRNTWRVPVSLPLDLVAPKVPQSFKNFRVANADNGKTGAGALWHFTAPAATLLPGAVTAERTLRWKFDGLRRSPDYPEMQFQVRAVGN